MEVLGLWTHLLSILIGSTGVVKTPLVRSWYKIQWGNYFCVGFSIEADTTILLASYMKLVGWILIVTYMIDQGKVIMSKCRTSNYLEVQKKLNAINCSVLRSCRRVKVRRERKEIPLIVYILFLAFPLFAKHREFLAAVKPVPYCRKSTPMIFVQFYRLG